jgi:hypothetical protein
MDDHPGGGEIMLSAAGKDGTQDFEDVGHSPHARTLLQKYYLDEFAGGLGSRGVAMAKKSGGGGGDELDGRPAAHPRRPRRVLRDEPDELTRGKNRVTSVPFSIFFYQHQTFVVRTPLFRS